MPVSTNIPVAPALPFFNTISGTFAFKNRQENIESNIKSILSTPKGSQDYNPEFGSIVPLLVFEPITDATINLLYYYIIEDLSRFEKRIRILSVDIRKENPRELIIFLSYIDNADNEKTVRQAPLTFSRRIEGTRHV